MSRFAYGPCPAERTSPIAQGKAGVLEPAQNLRLFGRELLLSQHSRIPEFGQTLELIGRVGGDCHRSCHGGGTDPLPEPVGHRLHVSWWLFVADRPRPGSRIDEPPLVREIERRLKLKERRRAAAAARKNTTKETPK